MTEEADPATIDPDDTLGIAVITVVAGRHRHLRRQQEALAASRRTPDLRCVVSMGDPEVASLVGDEGLVVDCPRPGSALPLAAARNAGARAALAAGAELLVFLDVDCLPGPAMIDAMADAHRRRPEALLAGPVTYLSAEHADAGPAELAGLTRPHTGRPHPAPGELVDEPDLDLFWSLSFGASAETWHRIGGFCEDYRGYGAEDTDFAAVAGRRGVALVWVGGAHAYHQFHPVSDPPVEHVADIVGNARVFHRRWGRWPMPTWLDEFERRGMIRRAGGSIALTEPPVPGHVEKGDDR